MFFVVSLEKYGIYPDKTSTSSPIEEIVIDAAKQLPYYFCRFFKVSVSKEILEFLCSKHAAYQDTSLLICLTNCSLFSILTLVLLL